MDRWNDKALDGLERRVEETEDELVPLRPIPALVAQHESRLNRMREDQQLAEQQEVRRMEAVRRDLRALDRKLDGLKNGTQAAARKGASQGAQQINFASLLATFMAVATAIGVPIAIALIASS